jgi:hypothetical protein
MQAAACMAAASFHAAADCRHKYKHFDYARFCMGTRDKVTLSTGKLRTDEVRILIIHVAAPQTPIYKKKDMQGTSNVHNDGV